MEKEILNETIKGLELIQNIHTESLKIIYLSYIELAKDYIMMNFFFTMAIIFFIGVILIKFLKMKGFIISIFITVITQLTFYNLVTDYGITNFYQYIYLKKSLGKEEFTNYKLEVQKFEHKEVKVIFTIKIVEKIKTIKEDNIISEFKEIKI